MAGPFQPTQALMARAVRKLKLTTKMTNKGYYKGTRSSGIGHFSHNPKLYSKYNIDYSKVRTFVCPPADTLQNSMLQCFVAANVRAPAELSEKKGKGRMSGKDFLEVWKRESGMGSTTGHRSQFTEPPKGA